MTSKIKVDNINKVSDDSNIIKKCGSTTTVGSGAGNTVVVCGSTVTLGRCSGTVALASGATQTGFGRTGTVDWNTTPKTATFTAVSGDGFFANTTGSAFNMNLPAGVAGAIVSVADYAGTWQTNALTVVPNGTDKIGGVNANVTLDTKGQSVTFIFVDSTQGWINTMDSTSNERASAFITASGGTETTCGDFKIHTFTGPGTFTVSGISPTAANNTVGYLVVAGGGGGGNASGSGSGGGGAGGYREGRNVPVDNFTASPLVANAPTNAVTVTAAAFPITVGGGGATGAPAARGGNSVFSTITSTGGGGGFYCSPGPLQPGGSGGGVAYASPTAGGVGNTPPVSPSQGFPAGSSPRTPADYAGSGGGGATAAGGNGSTNPAGPGGAGAASSITGSSVTRSGGGGAGNGTSGPSACGGAGGAGGGGAGKPHGSAGTGDAGTANTGGGGGGGGSPGGSGGVGGSGIVIIRYKFQ